MRAIDRHFPSIALATLSAIETGLPSLALTFADMAAEHCGSPVLLRALTNRPPNIFSLDNRAFINWMLRSYREG
jgi:hypothetical protein